MEFEVAMGRQEWNVSYSTHFDGVQLEHGDEALADAPHDDTPHFSLATGGLVSRSAPPPVSKEAVEKQHETAADGTPSQALVDVSKRPTQVALRYSSAAGDMLAKRSFRGLEPRIGETEAHAATMGHIGRAAGYAKLKEALDEIGDVARDEESAKT